MTKRGLLKKRTKALLAVLMTALALTGCGSSSRYDSFTTQEAALDKGMNAAGYTASDDMYMADAVAEEAEYDESYEMESSPSEAGSGKVDENVASNRKLIKRVNMSVETQEFESITDKIESKVTALGGYMEDANIYGNSINSSSVRRAHYTARIPVKKMDELVTAVSEMSNVTSKSQSATDVTLEYVDTQARKEALQVEQERLMALLEKADTLETIIGLEQRLTEVRYELQNLESKLRTYDNLVDFATVDIEVTEVKVYTPQVTVEKTVWQRMAEGFVSSLQDVGLGCLNFVVGLIIALPYLVVWAVVITIIVLIIRAIIKKNKKKREAKKLQKQSQNGANVYESNTQTNSTVSQDSDVDEQNTSAEDNLNQEKE